MIVLDTNVLSELMRARPEPKVVAWLDACEESPWTTAVTLQELTYGISRVEEVPRRERLQHAFDRAVSALIADHILPLDARAGATAGIVIARREWSGRPIGIADAQIAAIAFENDATLVTRDAAGFAGLGLTIIDPWTSSVR